jgi:hypothetical protein
MIQVEFTKSFLDQHFWEHVGKPLSDWVNRYDWGTCYPLIKSDPDGNFIGVVCAEFGSHENALVYRPTGALTKEGLNYQIFNDRYAVPVLDSSAE